MSGGLAQLVVLALVAWFLLSPDPGDISTLAN
jgi:hypothetical protein